ncbi:MAG: cell division protein FtsL [Moorellales bacterium]
MSNLVVAPVPGPEAPAAYEAPVRTHARLRPGTKLKGFGLVLVALVFLSGVAVVAQTARLNALGYRLAELRSEVNALERANQRLELEVAELRAPARLARVAESHLGLVEPDPTHVRTLPAARVAQAEAELGLLPGANLEAGRERSAGWEKWSRALAHWLEARAGGTEKIAGN